MTQGSLRTFAADYTPAWCRGHAASITGFFSPTGCLQINAGPRAVGRSAITASVQGFMTGFPDLTVKADRLAGEAGRVEYHWTLTGTNSGPGGAGRKGHISGFEVWHFGAGGLIVESQGHFDASDYERQLAPV